MIALIGHGWPVTIHRAMGGPPVILFSDPIPPVAVATSPPASHELSRSAGTGDIQLGFESLVQSWKAFPLSKHPVSFPGVGGQDGASSGPGGLRAHRLQPMDAQAAAARGLGRTGPKKQSSQAANSQGPGRPGTAVHWGRAAKLRGILATARTPNGAGGGPAAPVFGARTGPARETGGRPDPRPGNGAGARAAKPVCDAPPKGPRGPHGGIAAQPGGPPGGRRPGTTGGGEQRKQTGRIRRPPAVPGTRPAGVRDGAAEGAPGPHGGQSGPFASGRGRPRKAAPHGRFRRRRRRACPTATRRVRGRCPRAAAAGRPFGDKWRLTPPAVRCG